MTGARAINALVVSNGRAVEATRALPEEVPVALVYIGTTQAVMMATPCDLIDFGRGVTRTEGWGEIDSVDVVAHPNGFELQMWLPEAQAKTLSLRRRAMAGPVGCGLCGIDSLDQAVRDVAPVTSDLVLSLADVAHARGGLRSGQVLDNKTHAVHGAGFFTKSVPYGSARRCGSSQCTR